MALQVKLARKDEASYFQMPCTRDWAEQFEKVSREIRSRLMHRW
jgi:hypothetical protein